MAVVKIFSSKFGSKKQTMQCLQNSKVYGSEVADCFIVERGMTYIKRQCDHPYQTAVPNSLTLFTKSLCTTLRRNLVRVAACKAETARVFRRTDKKVVPCSRIHLHAANRAIAISPLFCTGDAKRWLRFAYFKFLRGRIPSSNLPSLVEWFATYSITQLSFKWQLAPVYSTGTIYLW
jgi:hypothetical protein